MSIAVTRWPSTEAPARSELEALILREDLAPTRWSNGPGFRYAAHSHTYHKVLYCAEGSIRFLVDEHEPFDLSPGDRLDVPPGVQHAAVVGPDGVTCVEAAVS